MPPGASASPLHPVPGPSLQPWPGEWARREPGPSSSLPSLPRSTQTASRARISPTHSGHGRLPRTVPLRAHLLSFASRGLQDLMSEGWEGGSP